MSRQLKYIDTKDGLYSQARQIRVDCFFKGMAEADKLINDEFEETGIHLICLDKDRQVVGTGRLHTSGATGIISQMAIKEEEQGTGIGQKILKELIRKCGAIGMEKIELSARETALEFYKKHGFTAFGDKYPSTKTGIIHQKMSMNLNRPG